MDFDPSTIGAYSYPAKGIVLYDHVILIQKVIETLVDLIEVKYEADDPSFDADDDFLNDFVDVALFKVLLEIAAIKDLVLFVLGVEAVS